MGQHGSGAVTLRQAHENDLLLKRPAAYIQSRTVDRNASIFSHFYDSLLFLWASQQRSSPH